MEVYVKNYIVLAIQTCQVQLDHVVNIILDEIHNIISEDSDKGNNLIVFEEVQEDGSTSALEKGVMGFMFNGDNKTWWLYNKKPTSS